MSNPIKAIGKAFKSVVKVIKKVALPALAIGAVILTGGAALGVLPSVGGLAGSLGLSAGLTSTLTAAATSATIGAGMAAVTGGNIIKGATAGFVTGGVLGGANAVLGGVGKAAQAASTGLGNASSVNSAALESLRGGATAATGATGAASAAATGAATQGLGLGQFSDAARAAVQSVPQAAAPAVGAVPSSGGLLGFVNRNPVVSGMAIQGLGQGLMASEQNKAAQRERDQIAANYSDTSGLPQYQSQGNGYARAADVFNAAIYSGKKVEYDTKTGRIKVGGA